MPYTNEGQLSASHVKPQATPFTGAEHYRSVLMLTIALLLSACGGGGGSGPPPPGTPTTTVSGIAFDAALGDALINIYEFKSGEGRETIGELLGTTRSNALGRFTLPITTDASYILIETSGGHYIEETSGRLVMVTPEQSLRAVMPLVPGQPLDITLSYYTTIAAGLIAHFKSLGFATGTAVDVSNDRVGRLLGTDILGAEPLNASDPANSGMGLVPSLQYGYFTAGVSQWTADATPPGEAVHTSLTSIGLAQTAYADISHDGLLDGIGAGGQLTFGAVPLSPDVYRHEIAESALTFAVSGANAAGVSFEDLLPVVQAFNDNTDLLFADAKVVPIESAKTVVSDFLPAEGAEVFGTFTIAANLHNVAGITSVHFEIDNVPRAPVQDATAPSDTIDSSALSDGARRFAMVVTSGTGNVERFERMLVVNNAAPAITSIVPSDNARTTATTTLAAAVSAPNGVQAVVFRIDGAIVSSNLDTANPTMQFDTRGLADGNHTFEITATNMTGDSQTVSRIFLTNNTPPSVTGFYPFSGETVSGGFITNAQVNDLYGAINAEYFLDDMFWASGLNPNNPIRTIVAGSWFNGARRWSIVVTGDVTGLTTTVTNTIIVEGGREPGEPGF